MHHWSKREQLIFCLVLGLLLSGWAVKAYRTAHRAVTVSQPAQD